MTKTGGNSINCQRVIILILRFYIRSTILIRYDRPISGRFPADNYLKTIEPQTSVSKKRTGTG